MRTTTSLQSWHPRSPSRLPDDVWYATVSRIRGEFAEMPCMRLTVEQARFLFGLNDTATNWILECLAREGFLARTSNGEYVRRSSGH
jgi:hypothetical protein